MPKSFFDVLTEAVADISEHGYDSQDRIDFWIREIKRAAEASLKPESVMEQMLNDAMRALYAKLVEKQGLLKYNPGVARFTLDRVKPQLRAELDRRILASANLIKLNRQQAIAKTLQRFSGWSTSIPKGGSDTDRREVKTSIRKALTQLPFEERRVLIDQGHKFTSALNTTLAVNAGAIAARWHSNWRQSGYQFRQDHKEIDGKVFAVRDNWAMEKGLMKIGPDGYTDQIEQPAELPFCRCAYRYIYNLRDVPDDMLTVKGRDELERVRVA